MNWVLVTCAVASILALVTAGVSLFLQARAGSTADLHVRVTGLRTEVSGLSDHLDRLDQRMRTRAMRDGREKAELERMAAADNAADGSGSAVVGITGAQPKSADERRKLLRQQMVAARLRRP